MTLARVSVTGIPPVSWVSILRLNSSLYIKAQDLKVLIDRAIKKTLPILMSRKVNAGVVIENVLLVTWVRIYEKKKPEPSENPSGFPLGSAYISSHTSPFVTIQIQYSSSSINQNLNHWEQWRKKWKRTHYKSWY